MRKTVLLLTFLLCAQSMLAQRFQLVTDANQLEDDCRYIFVNSKEPGARAQMMGGNAVDVSILNVHSIAGTSVTIGNDGIINLKSDNILGGLVNMVVRPEQSIYTLKKVKEGGLLSSVHWNLLNYKGLALSTARDTTGVTDLTQLLGQAQLLEVTDTTPGIDLTISLNSKDEVYVNSGETELSDVLGTIKALLGMGDIANDPSKALEIAKNLDPLRYLTASDVSVGSLNLTSTFSFNVPVDLNTLSEILSNVSNITKLPELISTNLYIYKEIEEPETFELVTSNDQLIDGQEYIILSGKQMEHGKNLSPVYAMTSEENKVTTALLTTNPMIMGSEVKAPNNEFEDGAYGRDGQSYVDVRARVPRYTYSVDKTTGDQYLSYAGEVLSGVEAKDRNIGLSADSTYAHLSIDINEDCSLNLVAKDKEKFQKTVKFSKKDFQYNKLGFYSGQYLLTKTNAFTFFSDTNDDLKRQPVYIYRKAEKENIANPTITPASNTGVILGIGSNPFVEPQTVTITSEKEGAHIYYTLDGSDPTIHSAEYNEPFVVDHPCTVKAIAVYRASKSSVVSVQYLFKKAVPELSLSGNNKSIELSSDVEAGESVAYTVRTKEAADIKGNLTVSESKAVVGEALYAGQEFIAEAKATADGWNDSDNGYAVFTYTDKQHITASFDFAGVAENVYNDGGSIICTDDAGIEHNTTTSPSTVMFSKSYPQIKNGNLEVKSGQKFIVTSTSLPYTTVTVVTGNNSDVKINDEKITPINGYATWHSDNGAKTITIEPNSVLATIPISSVKLTMQKHIWGDIDDNGVVDKADVDLLVEIVIGAKESNEWSDLNEDGVVSAGDITTLINYLIAK